MFGEKKEEPKPTGLFGASGGGFGGLGGKPDPEKAKINPFGGSSTSGSSSNQQSLFGSSKPSGN